MTKHFLFFAVLTLSITSFSFNEISEHPIVTKELYANIKIINDTDNKIDLKLPNGFVTLEKGKSTVFPCEIGAKVFVNEKLVRTIGEDDCGKAINISDWMK